MESNQRDDLRRPAGGIGAARDVVAATISVVAGFGIGWADSRPGWDATGITVASLVAAAFVAAFVSARRPWLWAILAGVWVPLFEVSTFGPAPFAALAFAAAGAVFGWAVARAARPG